MTQHDALRVSRRTAGVENAREILARATRVRHRPRIIHQPLQMLRARRRLPVSCVNENTQGLALRAQGGGDRSKCVVEYQDRGLRVIEGVSDFRGVPSDIAGIQYAARPGHRHQVFQIAIGIQCEHRDAIPRPHSQGLQDRGKAADPIAELPEMCAVGRRN